MHNLILTPISVDELTEKIALKTMELLKQKNHSESNDDSDDLITREEACAFLSINKTSLWKHTKSGKLKSYGLGNRVYYKKSEILVSVKPLNK